MMTTKRQAIAEMRAAADYLIEQAERRAKGWDRGAYRDDDVACVMTIQDRIAYNVAYAFALAERFGKEG